MQFLATADGKQFVLRASSAHGEMLMSHNNQKEKMDGRGGGRRAWGGVGGSPQIPAVNPFSNLTVQITRQTQGS